MKKGWVKSKFGDVCQYRKDNGVHKNLQYVGMEHIGQGNGLLLGTIDSNSVLSTSFRFQKGDVLYGRLRPYLKKACVAEFEGCCSTEIFPIFSEHIDASFLKYWLLTDKTTTAINNTCSGCRMPRGNMNEVLNLDFYYPPLSEQKEIVEYLDSSFAKIDKLKENAAKNLEEAKALFQSALKDALEPKEGCSYDKLVNVYNFIDYRGATPTKISEGVPLVTAKNVKYGYLDYTIKDFISEDEYAQRQSRGISHKGDLLFTTEAPLGNVAIADLDRFSAGQRLITFQKYSKSKYEVENKFYYFYMLSPVFQAKIKSLATGATAQGIKAKILKEIIVPIPSLQEQQSIVSLLDSLNEKLNTLQQNYSRICDECDALKQAILRQVFE